MALVMTMACSQMRMTPLEAIRAATAGGAQALRLYNTGTISDGKDADLLLWRDPDP